MSLLPMRSARGAIATMARQLWRRIEGTSAIEFAMFLPILLTLLFAVFEFGSVLTIDRRMSLATSAVADLVARNDIATDQTLANTMAVAKHVLGQYDASKLKLGVMTVRADPVDATKGKVEWSYSFNAAGVPSKCDSYALPKNVVVPGNAVVIVEGTYDYQPLLLHFDRFFPAYTMQEKAMLDPRQGTVVKDGNTVPLKGC